MQSTPDAPKSLLQPLGVSLAEKEISFRGFSLPRCCGSRTIEVAGIGMRIRCADAALLKYIDRRYMGFFSRKKPTLTIEAALRDSLGLEEGTAIFTKTKGKKFFIECGVILGMLDAGKNLAKVCVRRGREDNFEVFLRNALAFLLAERGGMLVHAAALASRNRAFLFPGRTGTGKTTVSKANRAGMLVLNDDLCVVRRVNRELRVFGTPFWGSGGALAHGNNKSIKLDSVLFLKKGGTGFGAARKRKLPQAEALGRLMGCVLHLTNERKRTEGVFGLCHEIATQCGCYELRLKKGAKLEGVL